MRRGGDFRLSAWCALVALVGCATATSEETEVIPNDDAGSGGVGGGGAGGTPMTGGTPTTGGTPGTGGTPMTGGTPGTGGTPMTGGTPGTGGTPMTGGSAGQGGVSGMGGSGSGAGGKGGSPFGGASMGGSTSGGAGGGGKGGASGAGGGGKGGASGAGGGGGKGGASGAGGSGTTIPCDNPRMPAQTANSGNFGTTQAVCYQVTGNFNAWRCSNIGTRMVSVNGMAASCGESSGTWPLPARIDGAYFFSFSAGTPDYTSFYWYTQ